AALLLQQQRRAEAAALLVAGLRSRPDDPEFAMLYGRLLAGEGHTKRAVAIMENAQPGASDNPSFHALLAALYQRLGRNGDAATQYRSALSSMPGQAAWWMGLGISLENLRADQQAAAAYRQALALPGLDNRLRDYVAGRLHAVTDKQASRQVTP
ncbi:MAG: tetratricopeptide repeat protein, partial [Gammaproteobacteria bacterium]